MTWRVRYTSTAAKQLGKLDKPQRRLIECWIEANLIGCENPRAVHGGKHMVDTENGWRYRVGSYRIVCRLLDDEVLIEVIRIGHRQGVYANLPEI